MFRSDINGLRAFAVIAVVLFHYEVPGFSGGYVGVDVFFVISGFLMMNIIHKRLDEGTFSFRDFYADRLRRIVPALYAMFLVVGVLAYIVLPPRELRLLAKQTLSAAVFLSNYAYSRDSGYFDDSAHDNWFLHTWSLSLEWQYYLLFPLYVFILSKLKGASRILIGLSIASIVSLAISVYQTYAAPVEAYYFLNSRAWELLGGAIVASLARDDLSIAQSQRRIGAWGLALVLLSTTFYHPRLPFPGLAALVPVAGAAIVLFAQGRSKLLTNPIAQFFGSTSYSLYLWHWPVFVAFRYYGRGESPLDIILMCCLATFLAVISLKTIEAPFRTRRLVGAWPRAAFLLGSGVLIVSVSASALHFQGFPGRVPPNVSALVAGNESLIKHWTYPENCSNFKKPLEQLKYCPLPGAVSSANTLVWGDSHVEQMYPAIESISHKREGIIFATNAGCLPVRGINRIAPGFHCNEFNEAFFRRAMSPDINTVIIGGSWLGSLGSDVSSGSSYVTTVPTVCSFPGGLGRCTPFLSHVAAVLFASEQLDRDVGLLKAAKKRVIIVLPFPSHAVNVPRYLASRQFLGWATDYALTKGDFDAEVHDIRSRLIKIGISHGVEVLDPSTSLCDMVQCRYQEDGKSLYIDNNHLSAFGAHLLVPQLQAFLK